MCGKVQACAECRRNCLLFHKREKSSSLLPSSFFKIMLGDDFSTILFLPPKFSPAVCALVNKKIILKDSSGQQWNVMLSTVDSHFALKEGWNAFSLDHGLEIGDFLLFYHVKELHFYVEIYDRSGCERLEFSKRRNNKQRRRGRIGSPVRDGVLASQGPNASVVSEPDVTKTDRLNTEADVGGTRNNNVENISKHDKSNGRAKSMFIAENSDDACHVTSQGYCCVDQTGKITTGNSKVSHVDYGSRVNQNDATLCDKYPLFEEILDRGSASDASEVELSGKNNSVRDKGRSAYNKTSTFKIGENKRKNFTISNRKVQECQFADGLESDQVVISKKKHALHVDGFLSTKQMFNDTPSISDAIQNGKMSKKIKKELVNRIPSESTFKDKLCAEDEISKRVKKEQLVDELTHNVPSSNYEVGATGSPKIIKEEFGRSSQQDDDVQSSEAVSCVVPSDNDNFLELPSCLHLCRGFKTDRMLVILRDPQRRLWPVLYHEQKTFKVLTKGWLQFRRANNIQPADVCTFELKDAPKHIFTVDIVHN